VIYICIKCPIAALQRQLSSNIQNHARVRFHGSHEREQIREKKEETRKEEKIKI
jgi:hypothetical protein